MNLTFLNYNFSRKNALILSTFCLLALFGSPKITTANNTLNAVICDVTWTTTNSSITINGLTAPHTIFKLFNPNWSLNSQCFDTCTDPMTFSGLTAGETYHISYNLYDENWIQICGDLVDIVIEENSSTSITLTSCPDNMVIFAPHSSGDYAIPVSWDLPTATTDCAAGGLTITQVTGGTSGSEFSPMPTPEDNFIDYEITDACGNIEYCSFYIDVNFEADILICTEDMTIAATSDQGAIVNYDQPQLTSFCDEGDFQVITGLESGSLFPVGTTEVILQSFLNGSNTFCQTFQTCVFEVTVLPFEEEDCDVTWTTTNNSITINGLNAPHTIFKLFNPNWSTNTQCFDNCSNPLTITGLTEGATYHLSYNLYDEYWAPICEDLVNVVIEGSGGSGITLDFCPSDISLPGAIGNVLQPVTWEEPQASTDCPSGGLTYTLDNFSPPSGTGLNQGNYDINYTITDDCGNTAFCSFIVNIGSWTATIGFETCSPDFSVDATSSDGAIVTWDLPTVITDCPAGSNLFQVEGPDNGSLLPIGTTFITYLATGVGAANGCSVSETCSFVITVNDPDLPSEIIPFPCDIDAMLDGSNLTISGAGLDAGHVIVKLFDPSWSTVLNCLDNCGNPILIPNIGTGVYHLSVNLYDENWNPTCSFLEDLHTDGTRSTDLKGDVIIDQYKGIVLDNLFPVPASSWINVGISSLRTGDIKASIYDARGAMVDQRVINLQMGYNKIEWDIANLPSGMYQILFDTGASHGPIRFIKQQL